MKTKTFRVVAISDNVNSFGLSGHVLLALDGEAWEVARCRFTPPVWEKGQDVTFKLYEESNEPRFLDCGLPRRLKNASPKLLKQIFAPALPIKPRHLFPVKQG